MRQSRRRILLKNNDIPIDFLSNAWSLRKIRNNYNGNACTLRIGSGDPDIIVPFSAEGELDLTQFNSELGASTEAKILVIKNQGISSPARDMANTTYGTAPYFYNSGLIQINGKHAFQSLSNDWMQTTNDVNPAPLGTDSTIYLVFQGMTSSNTRGVAWIATNPNDIVISDGTGGTGRVYEHSGETLGFASNESVSQNTVICLKRESGVISLYDKYGFVNSINLVDTSTAASAGVRLLYDLPEAFGGYWTGLFSEFLHYSVAHDQGTISNIIKNQKKYYQIEI